MVRGQDSEYEVVEDGSARVSQLCEAFATVSFGAPADEFSTPRNPDHSAALQPAWSIMDPEQTISQMQARACLQGMPRSR